MAMRCDDQLVWSKNNPNLKKLCGQTQKQNTTLLVWYVNGTTRRLNTAGRRRRHLLIAIVDSCGQKILFSILLFLDQYNNTCVGCTTPVNKKSEKTKTVPYPGTRYTQYNEGTIYYGFFFLPIGITLIISTNASLCRSAACPPRLVASTSVSVDLIRMCCTVFM